MCNVDFILEMGKDGVKISQPMGCLIFDSSVSYGCYDYQEWQKLVADGKITEGNKSKRNGLEDLVDLLANSKACVCSGNLCNLD